MAVEIISDTYSDDIILHHDDDVTLHHSLGPQSVCVFQSSYFRLLFSLSQLPQTFLVRDVNPIMTVVIPL